MGKNTYIRGQKELMEEVHDTGLCTGCGACVNLCPYYATSMDKTVVKDVCDRATGRCYAFCPRTPTDLESIRKQLFDPKDLIPESQSNQLEPSVCQTYLGLLGCEITWNLIRYRRVIRFAV